MSDCSTHAFDVPRMPATGMCSCDRSRRADELGGVARELAGRVLDHNGRCATGIDIADLLDRLEAAGVYV